jgi:hypothetical protein
VLTGLVACGDDTRASADGRSGESAARTAAAPSVSVASVATPPRDPVATEAFGATSVRTAYDEMVELATSDAWDPSFFAWTGHNTADLLTPIYARLTPELAAEVRQDAVRCLEADTQSCRDVAGLAWFDMGAPEEQLTYHPDGSFVTEQSVTEPLVWVEDGGPERLVIAFRHDSRVELLSNGDPVVFHMGRDLTYALVAAPQSTRHRWLIDGYDVQISDLVPTDPGTGTEVEQDLASSPLTPIA